MRSFFVCNLIDSGISFGQSRPDTAADHIVARINHSVLLIGRLKGSPSLETIQESWNPMWMLVTRSMVSFLCGSEIGASRLTSIFNAA